MNQRYGSVHVPPLTPVNKALIIASVGFFLLQSILGMAGVPLAMYLGLSVTKLLHGHIYQLITYPLIGNGLIEVVFNSLIIWFIGGDLESMWGWGRYISFLTTVVVGAGIFYVLVALIFFSSGPVLGIPLSGYTGMTSSLLLAYAILFPDRIFNFFLIFPMKAKYFCMILIGMLLYMGVFSPGGVLAWGHLGGMLSAFLFMVTVSSGQFKGPSPFSMLNPFKNRVEKKKKGRGKLSLVEEDENDPDDPKFWH